MKSSKISRAIFLVTLLLSATLSSAQVKIGTNPTTIGSNSNLEVEATNNKKVIVHKDNGTVVIENTPPGASTDSILTVDANGNVRAITRKIPYLGLKGGVITATNGANVAVINLTPQLTNDIAYTPANGQIKINTAGIYFYAVSAMGPGQPGAPGSAFDYCHVVFVNGTNIGSICGRAKSGEGTGSTNTGMYKLNPNDIVQIRLTTASDWAGNGAYNFNVALYKLSD
ncbi:hypothetical protein [Dyadobacter diqingensis]|uniref:hypothetical protein n=1 Tax=Dyadobacter diqingensis TaxID=2938121 RepID=UPI0020C25862|nr:hypothetical protein [Dyadobacter diqingensis]